MNNEKTTNDLNLNSERVVRYLARMNDNINYVSINLDRFENSGYDNLKENEDVKAIRDCIKKMKYHLRNIMATGYDKGKRGDGTK